MGLGGDIPAIPVRPEDRPGSRILPGPVRPEDRPGSRILPGPVLQFKVGLGQSGASPGESHG
jgi:hypothetical protein